MIEYLNADFGEAREVEEEVRRKPMRYRATESSTEHDEKVRQNIRSNNEKSVHTINWPQASPATPRI